MGGSTVDVHLARSASFPSCTKEKSLVVRLAGTATLCPPLIINLASVAWTSPRLTRSITFVATVVAMCVPLRLRCIEATLKRPGGPREEQGLTSLNRKASLQRRAAWLASPGHLLYLAAREGPFLAASPGAHAWDITRSSSPSVLGQ